MTEINESHGDLIVIPRGDQLTDLKDVVESDRWADLAPNYPSTGALLPGELTTAQVDHLVASLAEPDLLDAIPWELADNAFQTKIVPGLGRLEKIGGGEQKVCYALTTPEGKSMAVLLRGYDKSLGTQIPEDPKMVRIKTGPKSDIWEYSDLRTYLLHPVSNSLAVQLQEFGGKDGGDASFSYGETPGAINFARGRASAYVANRGPQFTIDQGELAHPRHYLFNQGASRPPAVIDIPIIQRK